MSNKQFQITALGPDGEVVLDETTKSSAPISEILMYVGQCAKNLWFGRITDIAISEVRDGN
jgi:hypothetical protein